jgi:hypothetical protein
MWTRGILVVPRPLTGVGGDAVIFDREIHVAEGVPMKSMSIEKLRTVLTIKNG